MIDHARAKLRLTDGREVWRIVTVHFREVASGRWVSKEEIERLCPEGGAGTVQPLKTLTDVEEMRHQIVNVQARMALDKTGGSKTTNAARLVLKTMRDLETSAQDEGQKIPWFILGRQIAEQILLLAEGEMERK